MQSPLPAPNAQGPALSFAPACLHTATHSGSSLHCFSITIAMSCETPTPCPAPYRWSPHICLFARVSRLLMPGSGPASDFPCHFQWWPGEGTCGPPAATSMFCWAHWFPLGAGQWGAFWVFHSQYSLWPSSNFHALSKGGKWYKADFPSFSKETLLFHSKLCSDWNSVNSEVRTPIHCRCPPVSSPDHWVIWRGYGCRGCYAE